MQEETKTPVNVQKTTQSLSIHCRTKIINLFIVSFLSAFIVYRMLLLSFSFLFHLFILLFKSIGDRGQKWKVNDEEEARTEANNKIIASTVEFQLSWLN